MMILKPNKRLSINLLIMYLISALLFLTSIELHIHTREAAVTAEHGTSVSISSFSSELVPPGIGDEIKVSPDGMLKISLSSFSILAVFLLVALMATFVCCGCIVRLRIINTLLPDRPFHGAPLLRAPPTVNS